jgi:hypothetical protein
MEIEPSTTTIPRTLDTGITTDGQVGDFGPAATILHPHVHCGVA